VLGDRGAEGAAADDDHVERSPALAPPSLCLEEIVAEVPALDVLRERSELAGFCHCFPPDLSKLKANCSDVGWRVGWFQHGVSAAATDGKQIRKILQPFHEVQSSVVQDAARSQLLEPSEALAAKTAQLKEKLAKLASELQRLKAIEKERP
jgi:hypothetical protein